MEKKKAPLPPCFLSPAQPCLYTQSQYAGALTHFHNCAAIPCGETEARTTLSETMVTHHLCDTRLAMPGVLSPGSCSQPWEKPSLALQGAPGVDREDPSPCAMSPPGPVDAPRCLKWLSEPFWVQVGDRSCTEIPLQTLPGAPPAWCFGCTHSCLSCPSRPEDTALAFSPAQEEHPVSFPVISWISSAPGTPAASPRAATAAPNPTNLNPK